MVWAASQVFLVPAASHARILFDATKAGTAGNADWVVADARDLRVKSGDGSGTRGSGAAYTESDPRRVLTPAINGITSRTKETYWQGASSAWAVTMAKNGQSVIENLPVFVSPTSSTRSRITYKDSTNAQDLSNYRLATLTYVQNGGSLFAISDHDQSDRNNDGIDAVGVWNDLFTNNTV